MCMISKNLYIYKIIILYILFTLEGINIRNNKLPVPKICTKYGLHENESLFIQIICNLKRTKNL
jgi:hypothetical protein